MPCSDLCVYALFSMFHAQIYIRTCLYTWICVLPCFYARIHMLRCTFTCLYAYFHAYMSRSMLSYACVLGYMFSTCFMLSSMCLCTPCHVFVPRPRLCLSCHVLLQPFCCFVFLSCVLAYWFRPNLDPMVFVIVHTPWPISKGLDHPYLYVYAYFHALCLCQPLQFQALPCLIPLAGLWQRG